MPHFSIILFPELYISKSALEKVVNMLCECLLEPSNHQVTLDACASLAAYISSLVYTESLKLTYGNKLLLSLFTFSWRSHACKDVITKDTIWEVDTAWQDAIGILCSALDTSDLKILCELLANIFESEFVSGTVTNEILSDSTEKIVLLFRSIYSNCPMLPFDLFELFFYREFTSSWRRQLTDLCVYADYVSGKLTAFSKPENVEVIHLDVSKYVLWSNIMIGVLMSPLQMYTENDYGDETNLVKMVKLVNATDVMFNLVYDLALEQSYTDHYKMVRANN